MSLALLAGLLVFSGCASVEEEMGPQVFHEASVGPSGGSDKEIQSAVEAAVDVAKGLQFRYDASASSAGRVVVTALWKNRPVTLTMRFFRKNGAVTIASSLSQPGDVSLENGGEKIEQLFYSRLVTETGRRNLQIAGDPNARP
jgi:hypothetical protein